MYSHSPTHSRIDGRRVPVMPWARIIKLFSFIVVAVSMTSGFTGCSSGSSSSNESNPNTNQNPGNGNVSYSGPPPQTDDIQNFKINVWDNLVAENRCGSCHSTGGQAPVFVRDDDINLAYNIANTLVDLSAPGNSRLVTKVAAGHNCWEDSASVCGDIITNYIEAWASVAGGTTNVVVLTPPVIREVGETRTFPADTTAFATHVFPDLRTYCADCHSEDGAGTPQQPFFASSDVAVAYENAKSKMDLSTPANSRFVERLKAFHECWDNCTNNAAQMEQNILNFRNTITPDSVDPALRISKALTLPDGVVASTGGRYDANVIALYEFKDKSTTTAFDTSGVQPSMHLNLSGEIEKLSSWGLRIVNGKAQASTADSRKLYDLLTATGEYSIEAWVVPDNVDQEGPARIVSYSGGNNIRNFTLGQTQFSYDFLNRSSVTDGNGEPSLSTDAGKELLQATLQHVVVTFDPIRGRRIFINGQYTDDADAQGAATLADWDDTFALVIGNEVSNDNLWKGSVRLVAIHNRALTEEQIVQNFEVGVGEKFFLLFSVSDHISIPDAYVVFEVQEFDEFGYLFHTPFFTILDAQVSPGTIPVEGIRIGVNGQEATIGQAYAKLKTTITDATYTAAEGQPKLSPIGTVIAKEKGPEEDVFFLTFDRIGNETYVRTPAVSPAPGMPADLPAQSKIGLRTFDSINMALANMTGVNPLAVAPTYNDMKQQLPTLAAIGGFLSAHQMGVGQLATAYCSALVDNTTLRASYFAGFNFTAPASSAFTPTGKSQIIDPLLQAMLNHDISGSSLSSQPDPAAVGAELSALIDKMIDPQPEPAGCNGCTLNAERTRTVVKATCTAALGSAVMLVQ